RLHRPPPPRRPQQDTGIPRRHGRHRRRTPPAEEGHRLMDAEEIPQLIAQIALADPRVRREDKVERRAQIVMWAGILTDVPYDFAVQAAQQHYAQSQWPIAPGDIAGRWQAGVRDRMNRDNGTFEPNDYPDL